MFFVALRTPSLSKAGQRRGLGRPVQGSGAGYRCREGCSVSNYKPIEIRMNARTTKSEGCWEWTGVKTRNGYGTIHFNGMTTCAHRVAVLLSGRAIPPDMEIDHLCRNRGCVNPDHLEVVTRQVNILRGFGRAWQLKNLTHCQRGHAFDSLNTRITVSGDRSCRACTRIWNRAYYAKRKERTK